MSENRLLILSKRFEKGGARAQVFVAEITGDEIEGAVFQFETWNNKVEHVDERLRSGNKYDVRSAFVRAI